MIYVVEVLQRKFIKVGFSADPDVSVRIAQLQTGNPFEIVPVFTIEGTLRQEQSLHSALNNAFTRIRISIPGNEWYPGKHPFTEKFLEHLKYGFEHGFAIASQMDRNVKQPGKKNAADCPNLLWEKNRRKA